MKSIKRFSNIAVEDYPFIEQGTASVASDAINRDGSKSCNWRGLLTGLWRWRQCFFLVLCTFFIQPLETRLCVPTVVLFVHSSTPSCKKRKNRSNVLGLLADIFRVCFSIISVVMVILHYVLFAFFFIVSPLIYNYTYTPPPTFVKHIYNAYLYIYIMWNIERRQFYEIRHAVLVWMV